jgi:hypothetical protein
MNSFEATPREFVCDDCPYQAPYPSAPSANDPVLPAPPCSPNDVWALRFLVAPTGAVLHYCSAPGGNWYSETGAVVFDGAVLANPNDALVHLGYDGLALSQYGTLVDLITSTSTPIVGWNQTSDFVTAKALPDGSFLAVWFDLDVSASQFVEDLWSINPAGIATKLGTYPGYPPGSQEASPSSYRIDAEGALYTFAISTNFDHEMIVRRRITGESDILYDESQGVVKIFFASLVTGP